MRVVSSLLVVCVAVVTARPEPPAWNQHLLPPNGLYQQPLPNHQQPQHSFNDFAPPEMSYLPPSVQLNNVDSQQPSAPEPVNNYEDSYNTAHRFSGVQHASGYNNAPLETQVHKHIYVHVPPKDFEEEDAVQARVTHQVAHKQKHYKIVFIKAPAPPAMRAPIVPPPPQNEEKTLIYVLHKKPELEQDIVIPTPAPTKPSKPEVYFIKYKTKKEEAPVYGPPGHTPSEPRQAVQQPEDFADILPTTTVQPEVVPPPSSIYGVPPTASAYTGEELSTTVANQYLPPGVAAAAASAPGAEDAAAAMSPIIVEEPELRAMQHIPATNYGPPTNRFFLKTLK